MKNLFYLFLLVASISFVSCSDDDTAEPQLFITATIDGDSFEADGITAIGDDGLGELLIFITGTENSSNFSIGLNIPASAPVDQEFIVEEDDLAITFTDAQANAFFTVGALTITELDQTTNIIQGDFNFTATNDADSTDVHTITDGSFRINYIE